MYENGAWPMEFTRAIIIPLKKKTNATEGGDYRTISLISHASKILLRILTKRINSKAKDFISRNQFGFRKGCGTREAIGAMRILCERSLEFNNDLFVCFVDFEKAFDRVNWVKMMEILKKLQIDWKDRRLIKELYMRQDAVIRIADGESEPSTIGRGVRQGCPLSPLLFSIYSEMMMIEAMEDVDVGVKVGGELLKDFRFVDDQAMLASTEEGLQKIMSSLHKTALTYDMKISVKKTKSMMISKGLGRAITIMIEGQKIEQVKQFKYLGAVFTEDGRSVSEVKIRIGIAKDAFRKRQELLRRGMSRTLKKKMVKSLIWPVALYASETWTLSKEVKTRLNAFEMWIWRRMERVSWKDKMTNDAVLQTIGEKRILVETIINRKKRWMGHILRGGGLLKDVMEGRMEGKRSRGRKRLGMIDELKEKSYEEMKRRADDREKWRGWMPRTCQSAENS